MWKKVYLRCLFIWQVFTLTKWDICKKSAKKYRIKRVKEIGSFGLNNYGEARVDRIWEVQVYIRYKERCLTRIEYIICKLNQRVADVGRRMAHGSILTMREKRAGSAWCSNMWCHCLSSLSSNLWKWSTKTWSWVDALSEISQNSSKDRRKYCQIWSNCCFCLFAWQWQWIYCWINAKALAVLGWSCLKDLR